MSPIRLPAAIESAGDKAVNRYLEFFTVTIRNDGTREAYGRAASQFFDWCGAHQISLSRVTPMAVAAYIQGLTKTHSAPTVKLHLAAIRMLCDWLVTGHILEFNPAASVRGPKHVVAKGKTPVLDSEEAKRLIESIESTTIKGLRDRALIGVLAYSFARISAALGMDLPDYYAQGRRMWFALHEKGGKRHDVPAHHKAVEYLDAYLEAAGFSGSPAAPIFRTIGRTGELTANRMYRQDALRMIKRRAMQAGVETRVGCHSWRATGITNYLKNGGTLENAARIAAHESPRTTKLYDRTSDAISLDEIERVRF